PERAEPVVDHVAGEGTPVRGNGCPQGRGGLLRHLHRGWCAELLVDLLLLPRGRFRLRLREIARQRPHRGGGGGAGGRTPGRMGQDVSSGGLRLEHGSTSGGPGTWE